MQNTNRKVHEQWGSSFMRLVRAGFLSLGIANLLLIAGCGGGSSSPAVNNSGLTSTITSVAVTCSPSSVQIHQTSNCSAAVTGTGSYSSSITWSVDNGTIDQSGKYTAPATPTTAKIKLFLARTARNRERHR